MHHTSKKSPQHVAFSSLSPESSEEKLENGRKHKGFGLKAPIIDIFDHGREFLTCFKPIEDLFQKGADRLMEEASKVACKSDPSKLHCKPKSVPTLRWIHIPANNIEWVEVRCIYSIPGFPLSVYFG
jgi:hypothetical protein